MGGGLLQLWEIVGFFLVNEGDLEDVFCGTEGVIFLVQIRIEDKRIQQVEYMYFSKVLDLMFGEIVF